ncbi:MAG: CHASE2 domain-containing protein [bacterium]
MLTAGSQAYRLEFLYRSEAYTMDLRSRLGRTTPVDGRLVYLAIDRPSYWADIGERIDRNEVDDHPALGKMMQNFPWNRSVWSDVIERVVGEGGAEVLVLDLLLENEAPGDTRLRETLSDYSDSVVIGGRMDYQEFNGTRVESLITPSSSLFENPTEEALSESGQVGHVNLWAWPWSGKYRTIEYRLPVRGETFESISARAVRFTGREELIPAGQSDRLIRFSGPPGSYRPYPIYQIFIDDIWNDFFKSTEFFEDKIVLVGPSGNWQQDYHPTPMADREMAGPEIHLNAIAALLHQEFLQLTPAVWTYSLIVVFGLMSLLGVLTGSVFIRLMLLALLNILYGAVALSVYNWYGLYLPVIAPILSLNGSGLGLFGYEYVVEQRERRRLRSTLDRYISEDVAAEILESRSDFYEALGGRRKPVTVLFADIRGFTTLSEKRSPEQMVSQLNEYLTPMVELIQESRGRLDKFIGDEIMAVWGDLFEDTEPSTGANRAVETAVSMRKTLENLNANWKQRGDPELSFGIGINHGEALFGNLGSEQRMELTVIGDAVNLAARLQGTTKRYGIDLAVSETVKELTEGTFIYRTVDLVTVKGKTEPTELFTVLDRRSDQSEPDWLDPYEEGVGYYRDGAFEDALGAFERSREIGGIDNLLELYIERCQDRLENPPDSNWSPVVSLSSK